MLVTRAKMGSERSGLQNIRRWDTRTCAFLSTFKVPVVGLLEHWSAEKRGKGYQLRILSQKTYNWNDMTLFSLHWWQGLRLKEGVNILYRPRRVSGHCNESCWIVQHSYQTSQIRRCLQRQNTITIKEANLSVDVSSAVLLLQFLFSSSSCYCRHAAKNAFFSRLTQQRMAS